jgi:hypothetical protein
MTGGISQDLIIALRADITQLLKGLKQAESAIAGVQKKAKSGGGLDIGGIKKTTMQDFSKMTRYYDLMGDSAGLVNEKMTYLKTTMRRLTADGSADAMKLANSYKKVYSSLGASGGKGAQLGRLGDMLTGGKMSQATKMLGAMGINMGAVAAVAGPLAIGVAAVAAMWKGAIGPGIKFNAMLEQQEVGFRVMLGSAQKASQMMADLKGLAMTTPIGFEEGAQGAKQLMAYGFAQNEIIKNMKLIGTLASATGSNVSELVYVYGTLRAQGQAYTRDLMQFGMRGIPIYEYLAKSLGVSVREIKKLTESGKIGYAEVRKALEAMVGEGGRFNNMLEEQMKTLPGLQTVLKNTWKMAQGEIAQGWMGMAKGYTKSTTLLAKAAPSFLAPLNGALKLVAALLKPIWDVLVIINQYWGMIIEAVKALFRLLGNLMKPITDAVVGFFKWLDPLGRVMKFLDKIIDKLKLIGADSEVVPPKWVVPSELRAAVASYADFGRLAASKMVYAYEEQLERAKGQLAQANATLASKTSDATARALAESQRGQATQAIARITTQLEYARQQLGGQSAASFDLIKAFGMDTTSGASQEAIKAFAKNLTSEQVAAVQEALQRDSPKLAISWETALAEISKVTGGILEDTATTLFAEEEAMTIDFWGKIARISDVYSESLMKGFYSTPKEMSAAILENINDAVANAKEIAENTSSTTAGIVEAQVDQLQTARDSIMETIRRFKPEVEKSGLAIDKAALEEFYALALQLDVRIQALGGKATKESSEYLAEYLKFRAEEMNQEDKIFQTKLGIAAGVKEIYNLEGMISEEYARQYSLLKFTYNQDLAALNVELASKKILKQEYDMKKEILDIQFKVEDSQLKILDAQRRYNLALKGNDDYWKKNEAKMGDLLASIRENLEAAKAYESWGAKDAAKGFRGAAASSMGALAGSMALGATQGTDLGAALSVGFDPLSLMVQFVAKFTQMLASLENFGKVLNFMGTIIEGMTPAFEQADKAFAPLVYFLTYIGEILGQVLAPIFEFFGELLSNVAMTLMPFLDIIMALVQAFMPLIEILLRLNTFFIVFDTLAQLFGINQEEIALRQEQLKALKSMYDKEIASLQDLYQVGAISGKEYERRLALLKKGMDVASVTSYNAEEGPLASIVALMGKLVVFLENIVYPILQAIASPLIMLLDLLDPILHLVDFLIAFFGTDTDLMQTMWDAFTNSLKEWWEGITGFFIGIVNKIIEGINYIFKTTIPTIPIGDDGKTAYSSGGAGSSSVPGYAIGTSAVPNDMIASIHRGEMIIPRNFSDAIRSGDLTLSGGGSAGGATVVNNYYIEGSVITERELYKKTGTNISKLRKLGYA